MNDNQMVRDSLIEGLENEVIELTAERDLLKTEIAEAKKDTARIDWIIEHAQNERGTCDKDQIGWYVIAIPDGTCYYNLGERLSLRAAIDAAMGRENGI